MILTFLRIILMTSLATRFRALTPAVALVLAGTTAGCGALTEAEGGGPGNGRRIAAAFYPLAYVAERVAGEHFDVANLTSAGTEPHDLELGPRETAEIAGARVVLHEHDFQPAVDATIEQNAEGTVLDAADLVDLRPFTDHSEEGHEHEEPEEPEEEAGHEEEGHDDEHDHGDIDPHFWQDPLLMADLGDAVAKELAELDAEHAADFTANAASLRADLEELDREYADGLASCTRDLVVVNHDAFGYLARYGLHLEPIVGLSPDAEPSAGALGRLQQLIRREGITTVFSETLVSKKTSATLAADLGIDTAVLDPIEGLTDQTADEDYLSLMRSNLAALQKANGC
jgi:zinc transport system substrate-binding protein